MRATLFSMLIVMTVVIGISTRAAAPAGVMHAATLSDEAQASSASTNQTDQSSGRSVPWYWQPVRVALGVVVVVTMLFLVAFAMWGGGISIGDAGFEDRIESLEHDERNLQPEPHAKEPDPTLQTRILAWYRRRRARQ